MAIDGIGCLVVLMLLMMLDLSYLWSFVPGLTKMAFPANWRQYHTWGTSDGKMGEKMIQQEAGCLV